MLAYTLLIPTPRLCKYYTYNGLIQSQLNEPSSHRNEYSAVLSKKIIYHVVVKRFILTYMETIDTTEYILIYYRGVFQRHRMCR